MAGFNVTRKNECPEILWKKDYALQLTIIKHFVTFTILVYFSVTCHIKAILLLNYLERIYQNVPEKCKVYEYLIFSKFGITIAYKLFWKVFSRILFSIDYRETFIVWFHHYITHFFHFYIMMLKTQRLKKHRTIQNHTLRQTVHLVIGKVSILFHLFVF